VVKEVVRVAGRVPTARLSRRPVTSAVASATKTPVAPLVGKHLKRQKVAPMLLYF